MLKSVGGGSGGSVTNLYPVTTQETSAGITPTNETYPFLDARRYGVVADGTTDNTAAMQTAHSMGLPITYPAGTIKFTTITMPGGGITGAGENATIFSTTETGAATSITVNTSQFAPQFTNFTMQLASTKSGGYALALSAASGTIQEALFFNVFINGYPSGINFATAQNWEMIACDVYNFSANGLYISNAAGDADGGDSCISACTLVNAGGANLSSNAIQYVSSGGLKIVNTKFLGCNIGVFLNWSSNGSSSDLLIHNCSIEGQHTAGIQLALQTGAGTTFENVNIVGCQFEVTSTTGTSYAIYSADSSGFLSNVTITGNTIRNYNTGTSYAIYLNYISGVVIEGNTLHGNGGTSVGIFLGSSGSNIKLGVNQIYNFSASINAFGSNVQFVPTDFQTGTTTITCSTAVGSLYYGTAFPTFPTAFSSNLSPNLGDCEVNITTAGGGGGIGAYVTSVSNTTIALAAVSTTNGGVVPVRWSARGII